MLKKRYSLPITICLVVLTILIGTSFGSSSIELPKTFNILFSKIFNQNLGSNISLAEEVIIWHIRFPRVILAFLIGAALGISGTAIQSILRNPLASPYSLGVSAGASLGVATSITLGLSIGFLGSYSTPFIGLLSGFITVVLIISMSNALDKTFSNNTIILVGMVFSLFVNGLLSVVIALAGENADRIIMWQMGALGLKGWSEAKVLLPFVLIATLGVLKYSKEMDALSYGENEAKALGVEVVKVKWVLIIFSSILVGTAVSFVGTIGFVGLIAPHVVRKIFGSKHIYVVPLSGIFGGMLLIITDLVARIIIAPQELPVGAITAIIGAPFFALIFFTGRRR